MAMVRHVTRKRGRNVNNGLVTTVIVNFSLTPAEVKLLPNRTRDFLVIFGQAAKYETFVGLSNGYAELVIEYRMHQIPFGATDHMKVPGLALQHINACFKKLSEQHG